MNTKKYRNNSTTVFINLPTEDKYEALLKFCKEKGHLPHYNSSNETEMLMRRFFTNKKNLMRRGEKGLNRKLENWEIEKINHMDSFNESIKDKLKIVIDFCNVHNKIPTYVIREKLTAEEKIEKDANKKFISLKNYKRDGRLSKEELQLFDTILSHRNKRQKPRIDKIKKVLTFCTEHERTPKQHVTNVAEKKLAEFLSSIKSLHVKRKLTAEETTELTKILKFSPVNKRETREQNINILKKFVIGHDRLPQNDKQKEKKLATFYIKIKWLGKQGKLESFELDTLNEINDLCGVKSRHQKIEELHRFVKKRKRFPNLKHEEERKQAVFFNNIKHIRKNGNMTKKEAVLLDRILNYKSKKVFK